MARSVGNLSALSAEKRKAKGRLSDGGGLYLNVALAGSKSWIFMWAANGKRREMGLGAYPAVTLKAARDKAARCRALVAEGRDPISERNRQLEKTFGECADLYIASMEGNWRNEKHKYQWRQTLASYCEAIRNQPVSAIATHHVLEVLKPIWLIKSETASRLRGRIELVLDFAKAKGWREGENPARWRGHLRNVLPPRLRLTRGHLPAMNYTDIPAFMGRLRSLAALSARALEFGILTAGRTSEVLNATWAEIDFARSLWTVPRNRMKAGMEHVVPLSTAAIEVLRPLYDSRQSNYIFPGQKQNKSLSGMAMEMLLRRMDVQNATVHGFRSSFRDWCGDETHFPREIAEAALAHKVGNSVEQAYRRRNAIEKRRTLMQAWADFCESRARANVVNLRQ